jgi:hypothetical protein
MASGTIGTFRLRLDLREERLDLREKRFEDLPGFGIIGTTLSAPKVAI